MKRWMSSFAWSFPIWCSTLVLTIFLSSSSLIAKWLGRLRFRLRIVLPIRSRSFCIAANFYHLYVFSHFPLMYSTYSKALQLLEAFQSWIMWFILQIFVHHIWTSTCALHKKWLRMSVGYVEETLRRGEISTFRFHAVSQTLLKPAVTTGISVVWNWVRLQANGRRFQGKWNAIYIIFLQVLEPAREMWEISYSNPSPKNFF